MKKSNVMKILALLSVSCMVTAALVACKGPEEKIPLPEHTHSFATEWTYDEEYHWHKASCAHNSEESDKAKHAFEAAEDAATCTEGGLITYTCSVCGYSYEEETAPLGHDLKDVAAKSANCDEDGYSAHKACSRCDYTEGKVIVPATGDHPADTSDWEFDGFTHWHNATCEYTGKLDESSHTSEDECSICGWKKGDEIKEDFLYELVDGTYTVMGLSAHGSSLTEISIPATHDGKAVTAIARLAFINKSEITSVTLPASITKIGDYAFEGCTKLASINLPDGLTELGDQVFNKCAALQSIAIPTGITEINQNMFLGCTSLSTVTLHSGIKRIHSQAFANCTSLTSISLPEGLSFIGQKAFAKSGLTSVTVANMADSGKAPEIAVSAFENCANLVNVEISGAVEYILGSLFAGCTKMEKLTVPFIGSNLDAGRASYKTLAYLFGNSVPATLTEVKVLGGTISEGAFDNCSSLTKIDVATGVKIASYTLSNCTAQFYRNGVLITPELTDLTLSNTEMTVGESITLTFDAKEEANVTVTVKKGEAEANTADYTYNAEDKTLVFNTAGDFTVVVTAKLNRVEESKTQSVSVKPALTASLPDGAVLNDTVNLTCEATAGSEITVTVLKDGEPASEGTDYTYSDKQFVFKAGGSFTITVKAELNGKTNEVTLQINIATTIPSVSLTVNGSDSAFTGEGVEVTLKADVSFEQGDDEASRRYEFFVSNGTSYVNADPSDYEWNKDELKFKALVSGSYKIKLTVKGTAGGAASSEVTVNATAMNPKLSQADNANVKNGWIRVKTGEEATLAYDAKGYTYSYNVTYSIDLDGATASAAQGGGTAVSVFSAESNTATVTITYKHKKSGNEHKLELKVSFVTSLEDSPVLGEDPFGGTYTKLIPGTGMMLYFDVEDKDGGKLDYSEIAYEVVSHEFNTSKGVSISKINGQDKYPFILVEDFDKGNHTTTGTVVVKLSATKDGHTTVAHKTFTVETLPSRAEGDSNSGLNAYLDEAYPETRGALNMDIIMEFGHRDNAVLSKEGIFIHRSAQDWKPDGSMLAVTWNGGESAAFPDNFQLDFEYEIIKRTGNNTKASFAICYRTGSWNGHNGNQTAFYAEKESKEIACKSWGDNTNASEGTCPSGANGTHIYVRLLHTVVGNTVYFKWSWASSSGGEYTPWYSYEATKSTAEKAMGAPIHAMQFDYEEGSFYLGNFRTTAL